MKTAIFINEKRYWPTESKMICPICGTYNNLMFYKNTSMSVVKNGKKICSSCVESFELPDKFKKEIDAITKK